MAADHPLVLVVEDLHWADPAMLEFLEHLVDRAAGTCRCWSWPRPGRSCSSAIRAGAAGTPASTTDPPGAADRRSRRPGWWPPCSASRCCPPRSRRCCWSGPAATRCTPRSSSRLLTDRGLLVRAGPTVRLAAADIPVPDTVQALIAARLDTLAARGQGAGPGRGRGRPGLLVGRPGRHGRDRGEAAGPGRAGRAGAQGAGPAGPALVGRAPGRVRVLARPGQGRGLRPDPQGRAGPAGTGRSPSGSRRLAGERVGDLAEVVAHHYAQALALRQGGRRARGTSSAELREPTRRVLVLAGDRAINLDLARAQAFYAPGPRAVPARPPGAARPAAAGSGGATFQAGRMRRGGAPPTRRPSPASPPPATRSARAPPWAGCRPCSGTRARRAAPGPPSPRPIELLEPSRPGPELCLAYAHMAMRPGRCPGTPREALDWAERALALADELAGCPEPAAAALDARGMARCDLGDLGRASTTSGPPWPSAWSWGQATTPPCSTTTWPSRCGSAEGPAARWPSAEEGVDFAERRGLTEMSHLDPRLQPGAAVRPRPLGRAAGAGRRGDRLGPGPRRPLRLGDGRGVQGPGAGLAGRAGRRPRPWSTSCCPGPARSTTSSCWSRPWSPRPWCSQAAGREAAALPLVDEADRVTRERDGGRWYLGQHLADLVRIAAGAGDRQLAGSLAGDPQVYARHRHAAGSARALLTELDGDLEAAAACYDRGRRRLGALRARPRAGPGAARGGPLPAPPRPPRGRRPGSGRPGPSSNASAPAPLCGRPAPSWSVPPIPPRWR